MRNLIITLMLPVILLGLTAITYAGDTGNAADIEDEFSFDISEFEKSPLEFGGYFQVDALYTRFNKDSDLYYLNFFDEAQDSKRSFTGVEIQPEVTWQVGSLKAFLLANLGGSYSDGEWKDGFTLMEGNLSWQVDPRIYLSAGKTLVRWGKGYAWNPVNFAGRDKNPSDPDLALEGYWVGLVDLVFSFPGSLRTFAITAVTLPVDEDLNEDFGSEDELNAAVKLYFLLYDTDIDLLYLTEGSRTQRYGLDFSRNITSNFEIHGEWALVDDFVKPIIAADGSRTTEEFNAQNFLLGIRYLTPTETTLISEYYHNGQGYTEEESGDFYDFIETATDPELVVLRDTSNSYQRPNNMRNYFYLRASQKEPFGWLYVNPALTSVVNLDDGSYNIIPEVAYTGITNLELRFRLNFLYGKNGTEYGEKQNESNVEIRARYSF